jgi:hypothetical protein
MKRKELMSRKEKVLNYIKGKKEDVTWGQLLTSRVILSGRLEIEYILQLLIDSRDIIIVKGDWNNKKNLTFQLVDKGDKNET